MHEAVKDLCSKSGIGKNWAERVESGDWEVDENGVTGGIEKFKDADTPEHWKKYYIPWKRLD
ncbi:uncharacterized protein N7473_012923 [Penicillium subrubescens]|uniref:uncharacterized protein n=1 Tax=Penicillium subrubescens TaxID=1316194 RepID=UPI00254543A3|nr:uncharacterized protein N7473_012923 [Penicillium subrubescens]KAJ5875576.1 hypothetical protein N7473_012923 [Penicillium subrubescens]